MEANATDRRAALKARHREAILEAARALVVERGGPRFSVDELADRADVARRTVFNHFASLDDVLLTVCADELGVVADEFTASVSALPVGDGSRAAVFDELTVAIHAADLPSAIRRITSLLDIRDANDRRAGWVADTAFSRVGELLRQEISRRYKKADPLDVQLLVGSLMSGLAVIAAHWIADTGASLDDDSRTRWHTLLTRLIDSIRSGYMP
ncbi:MAG TPA: TetR/AcrR family transcriptional regulator [Microbacteriaceae bacterium]|nr:TetR/AcrR family transcriptional regulator [Microbacteriaceae bacterium]